MSVGATSVLWPPRPTPDAVFEIMRRHQPSIFYAVPSLYTALLAHKDIGKGIGSERLRVCVSAGEALPAHIGERWRDIVGVDVLDGIGSTELLQTFLSNRPGDIRYGSTGKPVPGYEARIVDESGRELAADEIGELIVRGPSAGEGYWNQRAKSRRTFAGEWTYTGDKFRRDADGYYYYCGRTDDMFKVSGMWVSPFDVEAALDVARMRAGGGRHRQAGHRRADQAEGVHRVEKRLHRRRELAGEPEAPRQGNRRHLEISALDRVA